MSSEPKVKFGLYSDEEFRELAYGNKSPYNVPADVETESIEAIEREPKSLLLEAHALVASKRRKEYGSFTENITKAIKLFHVLRGTEIKTPLDGAYFLMCLKMGREATKPKRDNRRDHGGYLELIDELILEEGGATSGA